MIPSRLLKRLGSTISRTRSGLCLDFIISTEIPMVGDIISPAFYLARSDRMARSIRIDAL